MSRQHAPRIIALDIETTGLCAPKRGVHHPDEIIQLAIVFENHAAAYNGLFKPQRVSEWAEAQSINGITALDLADKPLFSECLAEIQAVIDRFDLLVFYNAEFDLCFLRAQGVDLSGKSYFCMMEAYSRFRAKRGAVRYMKRRSPLIQCARFFGVQIQGKAHDALVDANAVLSCYQALCRQIGVDEGQVLSYGKDCG